MNAGGSFYRVPNSGSPSDVHVNVTNNPGAPYAVHLGGAALVLYLSDAEALGVLEGLGAAMQERAKQAAVAAADAAQLARHAAAAAHHAHDATTAGRAAA
jgi:hypothetical protein